MTAGLGFGLKNKMKTTIVYYTANVIPESFGKKVRDQLLKSANGIPIISVSQKPIELGKNICVGDIGRSTLNIYRQALIGAKEAKTKYIAMAEDDALYSPSHFDFVPPKDDTFYYDRNIWGIYTWTKPPVFSYKGRRNLWALICSRDLFIRTMEERFAKYPNDDTVPLQLWGEPSKYERQLGVKVNKWKFYYANEPSIVFSHPTALGYKTLGKRKRLGEKRTEELEPWGSAEKIVSFYK